MFLSLDQFPEQGQKKNPRRGVGKRRESGEREESELSAYLKGIGSLRFRILLGLLSITLPALLLKEL